MIPKLPPIVERRRAASATEELSLAGLDRRDTQPLTSALGEDRLEGLERQAMWTTAQRAAPGIPLYPIVSLALGSLAGLPEQTAAGFYGLIALLVALAVVRLRLHRSFDRLVERSPSLWFRLFSVLLLISALGWSGVSAWALALHGLRGIGVLTLLTSVAMAAMSCVLYSSHLILSRAYLLALMAPPFVVFASVDRPGFLLAAVLEVPLFLYLLIEGNRVHLEFWEGLTNASLLRVRAAELERAQSELRQVRERLEVLVREKMTELEEANRRLMEDLVEITDAEARAHASEERFRSLAENVSAVVWIADPERDRLTYLSPSFERSFQIAAPDAVTGGERWVAAVLPEQRESVRAAHCDAAGGERTIEYRIRRGDGAVRSIRERRFLLPGAPDRPPRLAGVAEDVTERRELESSLRLRAAIFDHSRDAILVFEPGAEVVLEANRSALDLYGFSREEMIGMSLAEIADDPAAARLHVVRTLDGRERHQFHTVQRRKDGSRLELEVTALSIQHQGRPAILSISRELPAGRRE